MSRIPNTNTKSEPHELVQKLSMYVNITDPYTLMLHNDDHNTFDFIIENLIHYCDHYFEQSYQCALIAHNKGECEIKVGSYSELKRICRKLCKEGISVTVKK